MSSVGIMASGVANCNAVLREPFNDFTTNSWELASAVTIVSGRNGTAAQTTTTASSDFRYNIAAPVRSEYMTLGFAWRYIDASTAGLRQICTFLSDGATLLQSRLHYTIAGGALVFTRGTSNTLGTTTFTFVQNTWYYIEIQIRMHDTLGTVTARVDGTPVITVTGVDTRAGTATSFDQIRFSSALTGCLHQVDDLYLTTGTSCLFQGDQVVT